MATLNCFEPKHYIKTKIVLSYHKLIFC